jgi:outer membrane protein TolC
MTERATRTSSSIAIALCTAAASLVASPARALQPLETFLSAARERNPDAQQARATLDQQDAEAFTALGRQLPGVSLRANYYRNQYQTQIVLEGKEIPVQPQDQWLGTATLIVPLIDLASFQRIAAARTNTESYARRLEATRLGVESQTVQDYYQLLANLALVGTAKNYLEVSRTNLRLTETKLRARAATRLDVDRAMADVEAQVQQLASANLAVALVARDLQSTTSIAPDISSAPELTDDLHPEQDLSSFEAGLESVPSVAAAATATQAAQQLATSQKLALLPTIAGSFTEYNTNAPGFEPSHWYWQAAVTASWLFDLTNVGNIRSFNAAATATQAAEEKTRLVAGDAIHRYWQTVAAGIAQSRSARAGRDAAVHASEQARVQYQAGSATQLDLLQAQRDAFQAEVTRIQTDANLINARAQLRLASGWSLLR